MEEERPARLRAPSAGAGLPIEVSVKAVIGPHHTSIKRVKPIRNRMSRGVLLGGGGNHQPLKQFAEVSGTRMVP